MLSEVAGIIVHVWIVGPSESIVDDVRGLVKDAILDRYPAEGGGSLIYAQLDSDERSLWSAIPSSQSEQCWM